MTATVTGIKVLFILKRRTNDSYGYASGISTGLLNSAEFVHDMLLENNVESKLVVVTDNNDIDREVTLYRPTHVVIEALWVVPEKFNVLRKLHPGVQWIVRLHSEFPFIANEGMAMDWILKYVNTPNVSVGVNSLRFKRDLSAVLRWEDRAKVLYMPNYYPASDMQSAKPRPRGDVLSIGCFGAIRPLKNQLSQAVAAIEFANDLGVNMDFHINTGRIEMKGQPTLSNLMALFENSWHRLVLHHWLEHNEFLDLVREMDICMQVSYSETFNIVSADAIASGIPIVVSKEVQWAKTGFAEPSSISDIVSSLKSVWQFRRTNVFFNQIGLSAYARKARRIWLSRDLWN